MVCSTEPSCINSSLL